MGFRPLDAAASTGSAPVTSSTTTPVSAPVSASGFRAFNASAPAPKVTTPPVAPVRAPNIGELDAKNVLEGADKIVSSVKTGAERLAAVPDLKTGGGTPIKEAVGIEARKTGALLESLLGGASGAIQSTFAPVAAVIQKASQMASDNPTVQKFAQHPIISSMLDAGNNATHPLNEWAKTHPQAATDLSDALNVGLTLLGAPEGRAALGADMSKGTSAVKETIGQTYDATKGVATDLTKTGIEATKNALARRQAARAITDAKQVDTLTGTITQGKVADIEKAKTALSTIDARDVKTYQDLTDSLNEKIKNVSGKLDETLSTNKQERKIDDLSLTQKVGDSTVSHNYVKDAIEQLKAHYTATNDVVKLEKINQLEQEANTTGLTVKEVNDLARLHGQDIEAFNANGQAASGLTKQSAENTRSGLKSTAKELFGDKTFQAADDQLTALIRTRDLAKQMTEQVAKLQQKIKERTFGEKIGRLAGTALNIFGLNTPKGFVEYFLGRGTGLKTLNALDLEKALQKNLKNLQKALQPGASEKDVISALQQIIDSAPKTPVKAPEVAPTSKQPKIKESTGVLRYTERPNVPRETGSKTVPKSNKGQ